MMRFFPTLPWAAALSAALVFLAGPAMSVGPRNDLDSHEWQVPNDAWKIPFKDDHPITFLSRNQNPAEWDKLPSFWNVTTEKVVDPKTGKEVQRKAVKIKLPLGLTQPPPVPVENPMTVAKWQLGKQLYFDRILSSDGSVACASCHDPRRGFTDQSPVSQGIKGQKGGMSAPTVINSAYNPLQFWDGRAPSLEDQAQGPPQNPIEMFDGDGHAWEKAVTRIRKNSEYVKKFREVFGTDPTRDGIAKAIATYERTVLAGNSIHDRADLAMRKRVDDEETGKYDLAAKDYEKALKDAAAKKDTHALQSLGLDPDKDAAKFPDVAKSLMNGRNLFFNKARCNTCHVGDNFTDGQFHNIGVGAKDGKLPAEVLGRFGAQPTGHKNPAMIGAFKTPSLRALLSTGPYLHDGSEPTLEKVVDFYDRGGNANEFLSVNMRDYNAEKAFELSRVENKPYTGPKPELYGEAKKPVVPLKLNLTDQEKKDLVLFLKALQSDPVDPLVAVPGAKAP